MAYLKYYDEERKKHKEHFNKVMTPKNAMIIIKKLCKTLRIDDDMFTPNLVYFKGTKGTRAFVRRDANIGIVSLHLPKKSFSMGLLAHEMAHIYDYHRYGKAKHDKKHQRSMKKILGIIKRRGYEEKYCIDVMEPINKPMDLDDSVAVIENVLRGLKK